MTQYYRIGFLDSKKPVIREAVFADGTVTATDMAGETFTMSEEAFLKAFAPVPEPPKPLRGR